MKCLYPGYLFSSLLLLLISLSCNQPKPPQNIVFILVDDLGWTDLGFSGSTFYETPNIDALSRQSICFNQAYSSSPVCSPTRAAILTGQHPSRINITDWIPGNDPKDQKLLGPADLNELPLSQITLAEVFRDQGYSTFFAGKWHLGGQGYYPEQQGFDVNIGGHDKGQPPGGYYSPYKNPKLTDGPDGEYLTDRLTNETITFIEQKGKDPFFMFLSYYTVHTPIQSAKKHIDHFEQKLRDMGNPQPEQRIEGAGTTTMNQVNADYASMVYALDENIGRLIQKLIDEQLYDQTTIIFTSDNGGLSTLDTSSHRAGPTSVYPLRGGKGWLYEGGIRIPLLIKPAFYKGKEEISEIPVVSHDLYPTILASANIDIPSGLLIDGVNLSPILNGKEVEFQKRTLFWDYPHYHGSGWQPGAAMREGDWKIIKFYETEIIELYNLKDDLSEKNDVSKIHIEQTFHLSNKLETWQISIHAKSPTVNPNFNKLKFQ